MEDPGDNYDRYTLVPPQPHNITILITCNLESDRPDKERICQIRKLFWREPPTQKFSRGITNDAIVLESPEEHLGFTAGVDTATTGLGSEMWEQAEAQESIWRGIYSPSYKKKVLFSKTLTFKTSELPRWKPKAIIGKRNFEDDDAE